MIKTQKSDDLESELRRSLETRIHMLADGEKPGMNMHAWIISIVFRIGYLLRPLLIQMIMKFASWLRYNTVCDQNFVLSICCNYYDKHHVRHS